MNIELDMSLLSLCVAVSAWGGCVKFLNSTKGKKEHSIFLSFFTQVVTSCFIGFLVFIICQAESVSGLSTLAFCAFSGRLGDRLITLLWDRFGMFKSKTG